jgi:P4 family phage/plasmid primase-like protien
MPVLGGQVVDLKRGEQRKRTREDKFTFECPVSLVEYSEMHMHHVRRFVNSIFCNNDELIQYMRERMGMYLTGDNVREFDIYHGVGRNGKSTICKMLGDILGSGKFYNTLSEGIFIKNPKLSKAQRSEHTSHKVPLIGIRLGICQEIGKDAVLNAEELKKLSAGDPFKCRGAYEKKEKEYVPFVKLVLCVNPKPQFDVDDQAIIDRVRYIPFMARFVDSPDPNNSCEFKADQDFIDLMGTQEQRNLFFSWLVGGAVEYYKRGRKLITPQLVIDDKKKSIGEKDYVQRFIDEMYEVKTDVDVASKTERDEWGLMLSSLQQKFNTWLEENNLPSNYNQLGAKLEKMGVKKHRTTSGYKMIGIKICSIDDDSDDDEF